MLSWNLQTSEQTATQFDVVAVLDGTDEEIGRVEASFNTDAYVQRFWIGECSVASPYRNQGVGRSMVREALRVAFERYGAATAFIDAVPLDGTAERLHRFWEALGFAEIPPSEVPGRGRQGRLMKATLG